MTWVRIDEAFARHPKVAQAGPLALAMHVAALCYCNQYLTDGFVPRAAVTTMLDFEGIAVDVDPDDDDTQCVGHRAGWWTATQALEDAGLWDNVSGGWRIHDYLDYQPSKAQVIAERAQRQAAGKAGGQASAKARAQRKSKQNASDTPTDGQAESNPVPVSVPGPLDTPLPPASRGSSKLNPRANGTNPRAVAKQQRDDETAERLAAINACSDCDENGWRDTENGMVRCDHREREVAS